tara:strand:- start:2837 stop:4003 length:1167 start_codon:yes stop_codon:yes gene_type:complete
MPYYKFKNKDILKNVLKTHPESTFDINSGSIFLNNQRGVSGSHSDPDNMVPTGFVSLYEINVNRTSDTKIYPFITKDGSLNSIANTITKDSFNALTYGDTITGSYPLSASITREKFAAGHGDSATSRITALKNTLNNYSYISPAYQYSSSLGDKSQQAINLISIPSIFFDSGIKKGSVDLKYYISGTLIGRLQDSYKNGELIQTTGSTYAQTQGSSSVAGVVLYKEGFILLTGSWNLDPLNFTLNGNNKPSWINFAMGANDSVTNVTPSASFQVKFKGTNPVSVLSMHAVAPKGYLNNSSNPTYQLYASSSLPVVSSSFAYQEPTNIPIKNTVSSSFCNHSASFKKQTFISKIGIYDKDRNLIAVANMATPVKKTEDRELTFRLKLDI